MSAIPAFNYPKHPLFRIAPLLDKGVQHDEYTSHLVGRIRAGRYLSDLWNCNSIYLDYSARTGCSAHDRQTFAARSRYRMTEEEARAFREAERARNADPAVIAERAQRKEEARLKREAKNAARLAWEEEQERERLQALERKAKREAEQAERDRQWAEAEAAQEKTRAEAAERRKKLIEETTSKRALEEDAILANRWQCVRCKRLAHIQPDRGGYVLSCVCGQKARGDHETLRKMLPPIVGLNPQ